MATKSILKNITIKDKALGCAFVSALENAQKKGCKTVTFKKSCTTVKGENIKKIFGA